MAIYIFTLIYVFCFWRIIAIEPTMNCRYRSNQLRQDGGLCFEIPPWQYQPVILKHHVAKLKDRWSNSTGDRRQLGGPSPLRLANNEISRYLETVLGPFLDTYHRNIQSSYQQLTEKILRRIKDEITTAVHEKHRIYDELSQLADELNVPEMCDEERRMSRTIASKHVAQIYTCTEDARGSIARMGNYAEEMIGITRNHMQVTLEEAARSFDIGRSHRVMAQTDVATVIKELSRAAVVLGYELDLSLTNARRHNEQSCEHLTSCCIRVRKQTDEAFARLKEHLYECVYA